MNVGQFFKKMVKLQAVGIYPSKSRDGTEVWKNSRGLLHRIGGPAKIYPDGSVMWAENGKLHRVDGPAIVWYDEDVEWWIEGKCASTFREFQKMSGCSDEHLTMMKLKWGEMWRFPGPDLDDLI